MFRAALNFFRPRKFAKPSSLCIRKSRIPNAGYGVFCNRPFRAGEVVEVAPIIEVPRSVVYTADNILWSYVFTSHNDPKCVVLALGYGSMYNHSSKPNVGHFVNGYDPKRLLTFRAIKDIPEGAELLLDYGPGHSVSRR